MATPKSGPLWWDRDSDDEGSLIRADVRQVAHEIWPECCAHARATLGDAAEAPELMEASVSHVSRHLNRAGAASPSRDAKSLVSLHFNQLLRRRAGKLGRIQCVGTSADLDDFAPIPDWDWVTTVNRRLDFEKVRPLLSKRSFTMFSMRRLGHKWKEVGEKLGIETVTARTSFWRDVRAARTTINANEHPKGDSKARKK